MDDLEPVPANDLPEEEVPAHDIPDHAVANAEVPASDLPAELGGREESSAVGAAVEGLAKGVAGPLATAAELGLSKLGVPGLSAEEQTQRQEEHPYIHGGFEAAGLLGSTLVPFLGEYTLGAKIAAAGKAASAVSKSAEIGKVGQAAIRMGLEGGLFHLSDNVSKMILGQTNPEEPVSSLLAGMPAAVLLGGGLGMVGSKAGSKLSDMARGKAASKASQWLADLGSRFDLLSKHGGIEGTTEAAADQAQHLFDTVSSAVDGGFALKRESIDKLTQAVDPEKLAGHVEQVAGLLKSVPPALSKSGLLDEAISGWQSKVFPGAGELPSAGDIFEASDLLKRQIQELASYEKKDVSIFAKPAISAARGMADKLKLALEDSKTWGEMGDFQKQLNGAYSELQGPLKDFLSAATQKVGGEAQVDKGKLFNLFRQLGKGKLSADIRTDKVANFFDPARKLLDTVNDLHAVQGIESNLPAVSTDILDEMLKKNLPGGAKTASWLFDSGQAAVGMAGSHAVGTAVGAAAGHPYLGYRAGEALYPLLKEMGKRPTRWAVSGILRAISAGEHSGIPEALNYAEGIHNGAMKIESSVNNLFKIGGKQYLESDFSEKEREDLRKYVESGALDQQIQNQGNPPIKENEEGPKGFAHGGEVLAPAPHPVAKKNVGKAVTGDKISSIFPEQAMMVGMAKGRINNYLNSIRPQKNSIKLPFDEEMPDKEHERSYNRALDIANKPLSVLDRIKGGTLEPEHVKHMMGLYPELTGHLQKKLMEKVIDAQMKGEKPPYHVRQGLSLFMGSALDSNLTPQNIMAAQMSFAKQNQQPTPGKASLDKVTKIDDKYRTPDQAASMRRARVET